MPELESEAAAAPAVAAPGRRAAWSRSAASVVSVAVSGALLVGLYRSLDVRLIGQALLRADRAWVVVAIALILPITFLRAVRFFWVAPPGALPGVGEALRLTLVAAAANVFLPAKTGDLVKSYFVAKRGETSAGVSIAIVVYERLCDLFGLIAWCLVGWQLGRPDVPSVPPTFWWLLAVVWAVSTLLISSEAIAAWSQVVMRIALPHRKLRPLRRLAEGWPDLLHVLRGRRRWIMLFSLLLWLSHLFQIWMFTVALSVQVPFMICMSLAAIALMAGQLPLTFAGLGTRDLALVLLLSPYMAPESAAAMGVLIATRNLLPPLIGVPIMGPYLSSVVLDARRWRRATEQME